MTDDFDIITLDETMLRIKRELSGKSFDFVAAVGRGGILAGYLASRLLDKPLKIIDINFRDDNHKAIYREPRLLKPVDFEFVGKKILLTDDVSNTGSTLKKAAEQLEGAEITTLVISGNADISLYGPHTKCIRWPWS